MYIHFIDLQKMIEVSGHGRKLMMI